MKNLLLIATISLTFSTHAGSKIKRYQSKVNKRCESSKVSPLLLKKSLIELVRGKECDGKFTNLVINKCSGLNCSDITTIYRELEQVRSGSVVGEQ